MEDDPADDPYEVRVRYPAGEWSHDQDERIEQLAGHKLYFSKPDDGSRLLCFRINGLSQAKGVKYKLEIEGYSVTIREV